MLWILLLSASKLSVIFKKVEKHHWFVNFTEDVWRMNSTPNVIQRNLYPLLKQELNRNDNEHWMRAVRVLLFKLKGRKLDSVLERCGRNLDLHLSIQARSICFHPYALYMITLYIIWIGSCFTECGLKQGIRCWTPQASAGHLPNPPWDKRTSHDVNNTASSNGCMLLLRVSLRKLAHD